MAIDLGSGRYHPGSWGMLAAPRPHQSVLMTAWSVYGAPVARRVWCPTFCSKNRSPI